MPQRPSGPARASASSRATVPASTAPESRSRSSVDSNCSGGPAGAAGVGCMERQGQALELPRALESARPSARKVALPSQQVRQRMGRSKADKYLRLRWRLLLPLALRLQLRRRLRRRWLLQLLLLLLRCSP